MLVMQRFSKIAIFIGLGTLVIAFFATKLPDWLAKPVSNVAEAEKLADKYLLDNGYLDKPATTINYFDSDIFVSAPAFGVQSILDDRRNHFKLPAIGYRIKDTDPAGWYFGYMYNHVDYGERATIFVRKKDGVTGLIDHGFDKKAFDHPLH